MAGEKVLIIPDAHAHPQFDNTRFSWLGQLIAEERPDTLVCLGDFADMPSLSGYDKGKKSFEGRRYKKDVDAARDAMSMMMGPTEVYNEGLRLRRKQQYKPKKVMLLGNHEDRINRAINDHAELDGTIGMNDLGYADAGWEVIPYQDSVNVAGFQMSHHFASGVGGRPISGMNVAATMTRLLLKSAVIGHNHVFDWCERTRPDGTKVVGISAGCYTHPKFVESWNKGTFHMYWRGVIVLDDAKDGYYGAMRCVTQDHLKKLYG
jgi:hypothetical protein